jgi:prepilin-type N-terminal cleavage/methylation domain-containing protein
MHKRKNAFTLIELMVAMGIIGVLVTLSLLGIVIVQRSLRDTQRRDAASAIRLSIESHYTGAAVYPSSLTMSGAGTVMTAGNGGSITLSGPAKGCPTATLAVTSDCTIYCYLSAAPNSVYAFGVQMEGGLQQFGNSGGSCSITTNRVAYN